MTLVKAVLTAVAIYHITPLDLPVEVLKAIDRLLMTHKYRGSIIVVSISKNVEPNEEQKEMISGIQQGILCKH